MTMLPSLFVLMVLFPVNSSHKHSPGLICTNDFVNNVSCVWTGSWNDSDEDCWISGEKTFFMPLESQIIVRRCKLERRKSPPPGCSFVFERTMFCGSEEISNISMVCDGRLVKNITKYKPNDHIKMHPPDTPRVNRTAGETWISWNLTSPVSQLFKSKFEFEVQVKQSNHSRAEPRNFFTPEQELRFLTLDLKGLLEVRVRVKPANREKSHWSDWSPAASSEEEEDVMVAPTQDPSLDQNSLMLMVITLTLLVVVVPVLYKSFRTCRHFKEKSVPNPSKFFQNLHKGDLKKWLNPLLAPESFFTAPPCDISQVEVCENEKRMAFPPSSTSTTALLHSQNHPSSGSDSSGIVDSSSSLSIFSNMGYFMSSSSGDSAQTDPNPAYFFCHDHFHNLPDIHFHHPSLFDDFSSGTGYESLKREPESPDSGFGIMKGDELNDPRDHCIEYKEAAINPDSQFILLPMNFPHHTSVSSSSAPPHLPPVVQISSNSQQQDVPETAAAGSSAAMCRSSSMPVEPIKTGYLTLKELQSTFSNRSI